MERLTRLSDSKQRKSHLQRLEISLENQGSKWHKFTTKALQEDIKNIGKFLKPIDYCVFFVYNRWCRGDTNETKRFD